MCRGTAQGAEQESGTGAGKERFDRMHGQEKEVETKGGVWEPITSEHVERGKKDSWGRVGKYMAGGAESE